MSTRKELLPSPPEREELREVPQAPRMIMEIARLLRFRVRQGEDEGVMAQNTARLVLSHLAVRKDASQLELVQLTRLKAPTVSVLLRRMEQEGYVIRTPDVTDRRSVRVALSEKGREFDRCHLSRISTNDHAAMRGIEGEDEEALMRLLTQIRDNLLEK